MPAAAIIPTLAYRDVREAVAWLCDRFGLVERLTIGDHRAQLVLGSGAVVVTHQPVVAAGVASPPRHAVLVRVGEVDAHHRHALARGVRILQPPADYPYGERQYTAEDLGGHLWTFSQTLADVDPQAWGGVLHPAR